MLLLRCQDEFAVHFFLTAVEAGAILVSPKIAPGHQAFVMVNVRDLICKIYAPAKHVAHI